MTFEQIKKKIQDFMAYEERVKTEIKLKQIELEDIQKGNFTDDELDASIKGLTSLALGVCDTPEGIDRWYSGQLLDSDVITPEEYAKQIAAITREQVIAAAQCVTLDTIYMLAGTGTEDDEEGEVNE